MFIEVILLGIIQGITEYIPVSSSAHIVILETLLGRPSGNLLVGVALHIGTLIAVCLLFYQDLWKMISNLWLLIFSKKRKEIWGDPHTQLMGLIILSTLVTGVLGILLKDQIVKVFSSTWIISLLMIANGFTLFASRFALKNKDIPKTTEKRLPVLSEEEVKEVKPWQALVIGLTQTAAILPGISRSGTTITTALYLGISREVAGRFSFLISVPTIVGGFIFELSAVTDFNKSMAIPLLVGGLVAFIVGYYSLKILLRIISKGNLAIFSYYCWAAGVLLFIYSIANS